MRLPHSEQKLLGLVTRQSFEDTPAGMGDEHSVAVYLPMSYQIGGFTLILPRDQIEPIDMSIEDGLRFALTAGVTVQDTNNHGANDKTEAMPAKAKQEPTPRKRSA